MLQEKRTAVLMLCVTILRDRTIAHANRDTMGMENICRSGNISPAVFFKLVFVLFLSVWTTCVIRRSSIITVYIEI